MITTEGSIELVPMTPDDFANYIPYVLADYASRTAAAGVVPEEEAAARAQSEFSRLLPQGLETPNNKLYIVKAKGAPIGRLWYALRGRQHDQYAMILNMEIDAAHQGKGYGKEMMLACAAAASKAGVRNLRINLLGEDVRNRKLYESLGMTPMSILMKWDIEPARV